jgi:unsaturated chondroitin disaccharide hydrolase
MKKLACAGALLFSVVLMIVRFTTRKVEAQSAGCSDQALALAEGQLTDTLAYTSTSQFPVSTNPGNGNEWNLAAPSYWTSGFFPGELWIMYEKTLSGSWLTRAQAQTASMQSQDVNAPDHDIGFKILGSYGNSYRIGRDPADMAVIQTAANAMATNLWRSGAGVIESWPNYDSHITVIIDNMMNLELLLFAAQNGGDPAWRTMAISHAVKTMQNHVRPDGSTFHVVDYNTDGTVFSKFTAQGAGASTTWSRGQAWGLNGFTMVYRYTQDARFLATAQQLADYFINNLPPDFVPYWDFSQSGTAPRDSSAAAIAASGLLELSKYVALPADSTRYRTAALNILSSLSSPAYLGDRVATDGILLHGTANFPGNSGVDTSLIYGDYYFLQGCYRARPAPAAPVNVSAAATSAGQVQLTWTAQSGAIRYSVKHSTTSGGPYTIIAPPPILTASSYTDTNAAGGANYYVVSAINASGESPDSAEVAPVNNSVPTISSLSPINTPAGAPFVLTVNGMNFLPTSVVTFAGSPQPTTFVSSSQLTASIPAQSMATGGSASVTVTNDGSGGPSAAVSFLLDDFTVTTSSSSVALSSGKSATMTLTVAPNDSNGFANPVKFSLSGLPAGVSATFNPTLVTPGKTSGSTTLTLSAAAQSQTIPLKPQFPNLPLYPRNYQFRHSGLLAGWLIACLAAAWLAVLCLELPPRFHQPRLYYGWLSLSLVLLSVETFSGCAGSNSANTPAPTSPTAAISYVTVTAASGTDVKTSAITLSVQ